MGETSHFIWELCKDRGQSHLPNRLDMVSKHSALVLARWTCIYEPVSIPNDKMSVLVSQLGMGYLQIYGFQGSLSADLS